MARTMRRPEPTAYCTLMPLATTCPTCGQPLFLDYYNERTVTTLDDVVRLRLGIRRCDEPLCQARASPSDPKPRAASPCPTTSSVSTSLPPSTWFNVRGWRVTPLCHGCGSRVGVTAVPARRSVSHG
jgi:hypothetical protein